MRLLQGVGAGRGCAPSHAKRGSFSQTYFQRVSVKMTFLLPVCSISIDLKQKMLLQLKTFV